MLSTATRPDAGPLVAARAMAALKLSWLTTLIGVGDRFGQSSALRAGSVSSMNTSALDACRLGNSARIVGNTVLVSLATEASCILRAESGRSEPSDRPPRPRDEPPRPDPRWFPLLPL